MKSQLLNELIELGAGNIRSMDCLIAITLRNEIPLDILQSRIKIAHGLYPEALSVLLEEHPTLESFQEIPLKDKKQLVLARIAPATIALKMSHYLGDAISMLLWLEVILTGEGIEGKIALKNFTSKRDTPYRRLMPSKGWMNHLKVTEKRSFLSKEFTHPNIPQGLNDLLSLALLRSLPSNGRCLWVPVNVRKVFWQGFGNGLSRMRLYLLNGKTRDELNYIKQQKTEALYNGEVFLPPGEMVLTPLKKKFFKLWLNRPWADWGGISFSHLEDRYLRFRGIQSLYGVTNLHEKHHAGVFAFTQGERTFITLTFDQSVKTEEAEKLLYDFHQNFRDILHEISP